MGSCDGSLQQLGPAAAAPQLCVNQPGLFLQPVPLDLLVRLLHDLQPRYSAKAQVSRTDISLMQYAGKCETQKWQM